VRQKGFAQILVIIIFILFAGAAFYYFRTNKENILPTPIPSSIATSNPIQKSPTAKSTKIISSDVSLPHELLPGFNIDVPSGWSIKIKQFGEENKLGFTSKYWVPPNYSGGDWMGIRIEEGNMGINLIFDVVMDNNFYGCSDTANFENIGNNWIRIKDSSGYFYTTEANVNISPFSGNYYGKLSDEWSVVKNHTYKICYQGIGMVFESSLSKAITAQDGTIMLENPRIFGQPTTDQLNEMDTMVKSIRGIK